MEKTCSTHLELQEQHLYHLLVDCLSYLNPNSWWVPAKKGIDIGRKRVVLKVTLKITFQALRCKLQP